MKRTLLFLLSVLFSLALLTNTAYSQTGSVGFGNIQNVQVDNLSDDQILQFLRQSQSQNLSIQEVGNIARARGMPASEVSKLTSRMSRLQGSEADGRERRADAARAGEPTQLQFERDPIEESLLINELRRLVEERDEEEVMRELELIIEEGFPIFGQKLFAGSSLSFEPSFNVATPMDYVFGTDDEVLINVWGASEADYRLVVNPEGNIRIPNIGPVSVAGLTYEEARERILRNLKRIYSGLDLDNPQDGSIFADVALGNLRSVNVSVIGEVRQPGSYTVSSLSRVFNILYAAGGPNRSGTWREIEVIRGNEIAARFDLYDLLVHGRQQDNIRLKDQDIIKVNPYINRIRLTGEVKRPGLFELKEGETLDDLIKFTGGFSEDAYTDRIVMERRTNVQRSISDVRWPEGGQIELRNGDRIEIGEVVDRYENRVSIEGAVYREGHFELTENMTLLELIDKAEGVKEDAFMERGIIFRTRDNLMLESIPFSVRDIMDGEAGDIRLRRDDLVRISSIFDLQETHTVRVSGAVNSQGSFEHLEGMTLEDAIFLADGLRNRAAAYRVEVARRVVDEDTREKVNQVAEVMQFEIDENFSFRGDGAEFTLKPFDQVFVRAKPNYQRQLTVKIEGEVQFPGEYVLEHRDARLSDLIEQAGGLSDFAFPAGASMQRILEVVTREREVEGVADRRETLQALNLEDVDLDRFETINDTTITPVGIRLGDALNDPQGVNDLRLQEGDVIHVPRQLQTIRVEGGVLSPVTMRYVPGRGLQNYINAAGGTTERGQRHRAYIVYANGEVDRTRRFLRIRSNPDVEPGATIIVPEKPAAQEMSTQERISIASSIASTALLFVTLIDRLRD